VSQNKDLPINCLIFNQIGENMEKYIVVASYIGRSDPMQYVDAAQLILSYRAAGIACHIEEVK
jgi:hypothetical protein